jgi:hypothetical protein
MYYDRTLPDELLDLFRGAGPLTWLLDLIHSAWGDTAGAHLEFRRSRGTRGALQLYLGRTALLTVRSRARHRFDLTADASYRAIAPDLFDRAWSSADLARLAPDLRAYLHAAHARIAAAFTRGEAIAHAGLLRRYGLRHRPDDPLLAVDSEVRVGFPSQPDCRRFEAELRARLAPSRDGLPKKLDALGVLADGGLALIEVKDAVVDGGDLTAAVRQVAGHVFTFARLRAAPGAETHRSLVRMIEQKVSTRLLGAHALGVAREARLVPVVAAPDTRPDWLRAWRDATAPARAAHRALLDDLRFWRLSPIGEVLEEAVA